MTPRYDPYKLLGIAPRASTEEVRRAYLDRARALHPDVNPHDPDAAMRLALVVDAYELLLDHHRRRIMDEALVDDAASLTLRMARTLKSSYSALKDGARSETPRRYRFDLPLSLEQGALGGRVTVDVSLEDTCLVCGGTGDDPGSPPVECSLCDGLGHAYPIASSKARPCPLCVGRGVLRARVCEQCRGLGEEVVDVTFEVELPKGVSTGALLPALGRRHGTDRALQGTVRVRLVPHPQLTLVGDELRTTVTIPVTALLEQTTLTIPTLEGHREIPLEGTTRGGTITIDGQGYPTREGQGRGALVVEVLVTLPETMTADQWTKWRRWVDSMEAGSTRHEP